MTAGFGPLAGAPCVLSLGGWGACTGSVGACICTSLRICSLVCWDVHIGSIVVCTSISVRICRLFLLCSVSLQGFGSRARPSSSVLPTPCPVEACPVCSLPLLLLCFPWFVVAVEPAGRFCLSPLRPAFGCVFVCFWCGSRWFLYCPHLAFSHLLPFHLFAAGLFGCRLCSSQSPLCFVSCFLCFLVFFVVGSRSCCLVATPEGLSPGTPTPSWGGGAPLSGGWT